MEANNGGKLLQASNPFVGQQHQNDVHVEESVQESKVQSPETGANIQLESVLKIPNALPPKHSGKMKEKIPDNCESIQGHFGWTQFDLDSIPYILRGDIKLMSVHMVVLKAARMRSDRFYTKLMQLVSVQSFYISAFEARLLNEINRYHCQGEYGAYDFTRTDIVVQIQDAEQFYYYIKNCYEKLDSRFTSPPGKCGLLQMSNAQIVPYTVIKSGVKVLPSFFVKGLPNYSRCIRLTGFDLAYLKFSCLVLKICEELFAADSLWVISLENFRYYLPKGTIFVKSFPSMLQCEELLHSQIPSFWDSKDWIRKPNFRASLLRQSNQQGGQRLDFAFESCEDDKKRDDAAYKLQ